VSDARRTVRFALTDVAYGSSITQEGQDAVADDGVHRYVARRVHARPPRADFVKIDVEGEEGRVLAGAGALLALGRTTFCIELHNSSGRAPGSGRASRARLRHGNARRAAFVVPTSVLPGDLQIVSRAPRRAAART
jgi:hypothetical protein